MDADPLLVETWQQLMGLVLEQRFRWAEVAADLGITQAGLRALLAIDPRRPQSMRELATAMNCDPSYITAMIDDLEQAGLAERQPSQADRRVKTVVLTPSRDDRPADCARRTALSTTPTGPTDSCRAAATRPTASARAQPDPPGAVAPASQTVRRAS